MARAFDAGSFEEERQLLLSAGLTLSQNSRNSGAVGSAWNAQRDFERQFESASAELRGDREAGLLAVSIEGMLLQHCSPALQDDHELVLRAVGRNAHSLNFGSQRLRNSKDFVLRAVQQDGCALEYASEALRGDRDVVLEAVKRSGHAIQYAEEGFQGDREIVMEAVMEFAWALAFASDAIKSDKEVVLEALRRQTEEATRGWSVLQVVSHELRRDPEVVLEAVRHSPTSLEFASIELTSDKDFVLLCARAAAVDPGLCYSKADETVRYSISSLDFQRACGSVLACRGEAAPVLTAALSQMTNDENTETSNKRRHTAAAPGQLENAKNAQSFNASSNTTTSTTDNSSRSSPWTYCCEVRLLSGAHFTCHLPQFQSSGADGSEHPGPEVSADPPGICEVAGSGCLPRCSVEGNDEGSEGAGTSHAEVFTRPGPGSSRIGLESLDGSRGKEVPTLEDLARTMLETLSLCTEVTAPARIFVVFDLDSGGDIVVTPWDSWRPITDFLRRLASQGGDATVLCRHSC